MIALVWWCQLFGCCMKLEPDVYKIQGCACGDDDGIIGGVMLMMVMVLIVMMWMVMTMTLLVVVCCMKLGPDVYKNTRLLCAVCQRVGPM